MTMNCVQAEDNIAVVDLQKIVSGSNQVKQLKQEHAKKMEELNKIIGDKKVITADDLYEIKGNLKKIFDEKIEKNFTIVARCRK